MFQWAVAKFPVDGVLWDISLPFFINHIKINGLLKIKHSRVARAPLVQVKIMRKSSPFLETVTGRFAHFPVRPESFRPESFRPRVVSPSITWVVSPFYPESFRPLLDESFRPLFKYIFYWGYCEKFTVFVSFNEDFVIFLLKMTGPSSAEADDTYTCILFKLTS